MKVSPTANVGRRAVYAVGEMVEQLGWLFREQPVHDFGIDAIVEVVENGQATGQLLALQIKGGKSAVREATSTEVTYRGDEDHLAYWLSHALPVLVVLHDVDGNTAYWQHVAEANAEPTGSGWKLRVPRSQTLDGASRTKLALIAAGAGYVLRLRQLRLDRGLMQAVLNDSRLFIEADEWVNKSSGRGEIRIVLEGADGTDSVETTWMILAGTRRYDAVLAELFPWGALSIDEDTYEEADRSLWELETGMWDSEDKVMITFGDFDEWRAMRFGTDALRAYTDDGEVAQWRLEVTLNALGRAFLEVDRYLEDG